MKKKEEAEEESFEILMKEYAENKDRIMNEISKLSEEKKEDFIEYLLYVDKKTGLANRQKCDSYIENLSKNVLPDNFTCIYLNFISLSSLTKKYGYSVGDSVMKDFAGLLNALSDENGFIGYNGVGKFMMFVQKCNSQKAEAIMQVLKEQVEEYNNINPDYKMDYTYSYSVSTDDNIYEARTLLRNTIAKMNNK